MLDVVGNGAPGVSQWHIAVTQGTQAGICNACSSSQVLDQLISGNIQHPKSGGVAVGSAGKDCISDHHHHTRGNSRCYFVTLRWRTG